MRILAGYFGLLAAILNAQSLTLQISNETVPAGGWAQIQILASPPQQIAAGRIVMTFDSAVFGPISNVAVFSAEGDAAGVVNVLSQSLDVTFQSDAAGIGQLPTLPILTVTIPVLASVPAGTVSAITLDASSPPWTDPHGNALAVNMVTPGSVTIGGSLSVESVTPGGGPLAGGSQVRVLGTGFTASTTVSIPEVSIASMQVAGPGEIDLTLGGSAELTGKRVELADPDGSQVEYFAAMPSAPDQVPSNFSTIQPLLPMQTWTSAAAAFTDRGGGIALQNTNSAAVNVILQTISPVARIAAQTTVTIPPGALYVYDTNTPGIPSGDGFRAFTSQPIRMLGLSIQFGPGTLGLAPAPVVPALPPVQQIAATPAGISFNWQLGTAAPAPITVSLLSTPAETSFAFGVSGPGAPFSAMVSTSQALPATLTVTANPAGLGPGLYSDNIVLTPEGPNGVATTIPVSLTVDAQPMLNASPAILTFAGPDNYSQILSVASNGDPVSFTATANASGASWLSVSPSSGTTPARLTVSVNSLQLSQGSYSGQIVITGPNNSVTVPVHLTVDIADIFIFSPTSATFSVKSGSSPPPAQTVLVYGPSTGAAFSASTVSGGNWLTVSKTTSGQLGAVLMANPAGLAAGVYTGTITLTSPASPLPAQFPVMLVIWNNEPVLTVSPPAVTYTTTLPANPFQPSPAPQSLQVTSGGVPLNCTQSGAPAAFVTPASIPVYLDAQAKLGTNEYNITIKCGSQTVVVPVTTIVTTDPLAPPLIGSIVNAASQIPGAVAPGEILSIYGFGAGPSLTSGLTLDLSGNVATNLQGAQILLDGNPAPMIYGSATQANVIVPYEVAGQAATTISLLSGGVTSVQWTVPIARSAPGIFSLSGAGSGQAAVLNQDNSVNSASNPAPRGSVIQIYATGEGQTSPPGVTGSVTGADLPGPVLPVTATIGGVDAAVQYAGASGHSIAGLLQVNAVVPFDVTPGPQVPLIISIGGAPSQSGLTIAVQ